MKKQLLLISILFNSVALCMEPDDEQVRRGLARLQDFWNEHIERPRERRAAELEEQDRQNQLNEELMTATIDNNVQQARALIEAGADIRYVRENDNPPNAFLHAVKNGYLELCELFIDAGIDINDIRIKFAFPTALFYAPNYETGTFLLAHGGKLDRTDGCGWTALHQAASDGIFELCKLYIQVGADIHASNAFGMCPLGSAAIGIGSVAIGNLRCDIPTCELLAEKMLAIPTQKQKERMYSFLWSLKQLAKQYRLLYNIDLRKHLVRVVIRHENLPLVIEQISKTHQKDVQKDLLAKLAPHHQ